MFYRKCILQYDHKYDIYPYHKHSMMILLSVCVLLNHDMLGAETALLQE